MASTVYDSSSQPRPTTERSPASTSLPIRLWRHWQDSRRLRHIESLPFAVMKDIGYRVTEPRHGR